MICLDLSAVGPERLPQLKVQLAQSLHAWLQGPGVALSVCVCVNLRGPSKCLFFGLPVNNQGPKRGSQTLRQSRVAVSIPVLEDWEPPPLSLDHHDTARARPVLRVKLPAHFASSTNEKLGYSISTFANGLLTKQMLSTT